MNPHQLSFVNASELARFIPSCQLQYMSGPVLRGNEDEEDSGSLSTLHTASLNSRASGNAVISTSSAAAVQGKVLKFPGGCHVIKNEPPPVVAPQTTTRKDSALDPRKYKTHLCRNWLRTGVCAFAEGCVYAHGSQELRKESENINVLSLLEKLASQCKAPATKEAASTAEATSRRKTKKHSRRTKGKASGSQSTSKIDWVQGEGVTQDDGDEVVFDLPLNGALHIETDDEDGTDSELVPSPNRHLSGDFSAEGIQTELNLRKAASFPVNEVEGRRALDEQRLTSHSFQPFVTQRQSGVSIPPPAVIVSQPIPKPEEEIDIQKLTTIVKDSQARIQNLESEVALLKSCLSELLKSCESKRHDARQLSKPDSPSTFTTTVVKPVAPLTNATSLSFFNFQSG